RSLEHCSNVLVQVCWVEGSHDGGMYVRIGNGEAEQELCRRHTLQQFVHPGMRPELPDVGRAMPGAWLSTGHTAADDDARSGLSRGGDGSLVLRLQGRVGNLQNIKHTHRNVIGDVGQNGGTAQEANLAGALEVLERLDGAIVLQHVPGWAEVELDYVQVISLHAP